jgi:hypothetical protein
MRTRLLRLFALLAVLATFAVAPVGVSADTPACDAEASLSGTLTVTGTTASGQITNSSPSCSFQVGLASYRKLDEVVDHQQLYDYVTATIPPHSTLTLTVNVPTCAAQTDLFYGALLTSLNGQRYGDRLLDVRATGGTSYCTAGCTLTQGYWKTHPEAWPVTSLTLGTVTYTQAQLLSILNQPVQGNGLIALAHQLIAAKLNALSGATPSSAITQADTLIGSLVVPPVGSGSLAPSATSTLVGALDSYNSGTTGPGHCPS